MSFRQKLLLLFAATVLLCVAVISASVYSTIGRSFAQADRERANAVAAQFRSEFQRRGLLVANKVDSVAASETVQRIALNLNRSAPDTSGYASEARTLASQQQLDFLELVDSRGVIISSAQWQAKFGYPEAAIAAAVSSNSAPSSSVPSNMLRYCFRECSSSGGVSETRRASRWRNSRPVCGADGPRRGAACVRDRRGTS